MGKIIYSFVKDGVRYDRPQDAIQSLQKEEVIAEKKPTISVGAIVTLNGHKGKVLGMNGDTATVSWEDASQSEVSASSLGYAGRVEKITAPVKMSKLSRILGKIALRKGGQGSGRYPKGSGEEKVGGDKGVLEILADKAKDAIPHDDVNFKQDELRNLWGSGQNIVHEGTTYRVGRMSYGDYFLEPGKPQGETKGFNPGTLWLERVKGDNFVIGKLAKGGPGSGRYPAGSGNSIENKTEGDTRFKIARIIPHEYWGDQSGFKAEKVYVIEDDKHPDPSKLMMWGRTARGEVISDFKGRFTRAGNTINVSYRIPQMQTATQEKQLKIKAIDEHITRLHPPAQKMSKGGPGSGRYPAGSGGDKIENKTEGEKYRVDATGKEQMNFSEYEKTLKGKSDDELMGIIKDAKQASTAMPEGHKAGFYQDEVHAVVKELNERGKAKAIEAMPKSEFDAIYDKYDAKDYFGYKAGNAREVSSGGQPLYTKATVIADKQKLYDFLVSSRLPQMMRGEMPPQREKLSWEVYNKMQAKRSTQKMLKGGPGSGRYPAGSGESKDGSEPKTKGPYVVVHPSDKGFGVQLNTFPTTAHGGGQVVRDDFKTKEEALQFADKMKGGDYQEVISEG